MTLSATPPRNDYVGNNSTAVYSYLFKIFAATDLRVTTEDTNGVLTPLAYLTDYTVTGVNSASGGTITLLAGNLATGYALTIRFDRTPIQSTDLRNQGSFFPDTHENKFDELTRYVQQNQDALDRSLHLPETEAGTPTLTELPPLALRKNTTLGFDANGALTAIASMIATANVSGFAATVLAAASAAAARTVLGVPASTGGALATAVLTGCTAAADPVTALGLATKQYVDSVPNGTVNSYTGNATIGAGVAVAVLSGASFTLTLNTAVGHNGQEITFIHAGTSLSQVYTIDGNAAETIDGTTTYLLYTAGEQLTVVSDGTNWIVKSHTAVTTWADAGPMVITATSVNPTKPTTPVYDHVFWRRQGQHVYLRYVFQVGSAAGSAAGTGVYLFALPTNLALDTTVIAPVATPISTAVRSEAARSSIPALAFVQVDSTSNSQCAVFAYDSTHFQVWRLDTLNAPVGASSGILTTANLSYYFEFNVQAANWR